MGGTAPPFLVSHRPYLAFDGFVAKSTSVLAVCDLMRRLADTNIPVLVIGESGTGKTKVAQVIHGITSRRAQPILSYACAASRDEIGEGELFGFGRGFGPSAGRQGMLERADSGTILLEEVAELPRPLQLKVAHYLQHKEFHRLGESVPTKADARIIATTSVDLEAAVRKEQFSKELFYRLSVGAIHLPPLRGRWEDILVLSDYFLTVISARERRPRPQMPASLIQRFLDYDWPGNVRELEARLERAIALGQVEVGLEVLPPRQVSEPTMVLPSAGIDLTAYLAAIERKLFEQALERAGGIQTKAAELLGLSFRQFRYRLAKLGIKHRHT